MATRRKAAAVPLPKHVYRQPRPSGKVDHYWQAGRGTDHPAPRVKIPYDPADPRFWTLAETLNRGLDATPAPGVGTFDALIEAYKGCQRYGILSESSKDTYDIALARIAAAWGPLKVGGLQPVNIYELMDQYRKRPSMGNMIVKVLKNLLREGVRRGYCQTNVAREIDMMDEAGVGSEPWPEEAWRYVLTKAPELLIRAAVLARATGQRASDLVKLRPADRVRNGIQLTVKKLGEEPHWVPIAADMLAIIDGWSVSRIMPYLTHNGARVNEDVLRAIWKDWKGKHPSLPQDITLHDLRAMAVCDRRLAGVPHQQIVDQIRMSPNMVMRYSKHIDRAANAQAGMVIFERSRNAECNQPEEDVQPRGLK